jgi:hypothetical protein
VSSCPLDCPHYEDVRARYVDLLTTRSYCLTGKDFQRDQVLIAKYVECYGGAERRILHGTLRYFPGIIWC